MLERCGLLGRLSFLNGSIDAFCKNAPRTGRPATVTAETESRIVQAKLYEKPIDATR